MNQLTNKAVAEYIMEESSASPDKLNEEKMVHLEYVPKHPDKFNDKM